MKTSKMIKIFGTVAAVGGLAMTLLNDWVNDKKLDEKINERVDMRLAALNDDEDDEES